MSFSISFIRACIFPAVSGLSCIYWHHHIVPTAARANTDINWGCQTTINTNTCSPDYANEFMKWSSNSMLLTTFEFIFSSTFSVSLHVQQFELWTKWLRVFRWHFEMHFSERKVVYYVWLRFHRSLFLGIQLTIIQHWFRYFFVLNRRHTITQTNQC